MITQLLDRVEVTPEGGRERERERGRLFISLAPFAEQTGLKAPCIMHDP